MNLYKKEWKRGLERVEHPFLSNLTTSIKSISVSLEFAALADQHRLSWSEAARIGMSILLAEKGEREYDNQMNIVRKMQFFKDQAETALQELDKLKADLLLNK